ncbi:MAG: cytochrome C [Candidatus Desulfofervidaceae bacterium]|nr:cytochrome C [Candidatus Desulfofervidaceae bacterium]
MRKVISILGLFGFCLALVMAGCVQPQVKPTEQPAEKGKQKVGKEELYVPEVKPMTPAECGRCHAAVYRTVLKEGGKHKFQCTNCHKMYHIFRAEEKWEQIIPKCTDCHGYPHGKGKAVTACQSCHIDGHAPRKLPMSQNLEANCDKCHPKVIAEMKKFPSKHSEQKCSACHEKHGYIPSCMDCHEPHVASLTTNKQCLACHPVHSPTRRLGYKPDTPNEICGACHKDVAETLAANETKHHDVACVECHIKHKYIPKCSECHDQPHSETLLKKFPDCLTCHIDPHNLPSKAATTSGEKK